MGQNCVPECESSGSVWRCIEPMSFFSHLNIEVPSCIPSNVAMGLLIKIPGASSNLGKVCDSSDNCVTGNCVPLCDEKESQTSIYLLPSPNKPLYYPGRCIEPVFSFARYKKPIPACISEEFHLDHI